MAAPGSRFIRIIKLRMHSLSRLLPFVLLALIAGSLAWQGLAWHRLLHSQSAVAAAAALPPEAEQDLQALLPLFADTQSASAATPATNLQWVLLGSFVHPEQQQASALIQNEDAKAKRYRVGDQLAPGIRLQAVYANRVELLRNGRLETLPFKRAARQDTRADEWAEEPALPGLDPEQLQRELESLGEQLQPEAATEPSMEGSQ